MAKFIAIVICFPAILLPWRLRIIYAELVGWVVQFLYFTYYSLLNFLLKELRADTQGKVDEK